MKVGIKRALFQEIFSIIHNIQHPCKQFPGREFRHSNMTSINPDFCRVKHDNEMGSSEYLVFRQKISQFSMKNRLFYSLLIGFSLWREESTTDIAHALTRHPFGSGHE